MIKLTKQIQVTKKKKVLFRPLEQKKPQTIWVGFFFYFSILSKFLMNS